MSLIFKTFIALVIILYITSKSTEPELSELDCSKEPKFNYLQISTNENENSEDFNILIMKNCNIDKKWQISQDNTRMCQIPERVFEGEDNLRRAFRFTYINDKDNLEIIEIKNIHLIYPKSVAETTLTNNNMILHPGESRDIYLDYDCWNMNINKRSDWYKIKFVIEFDKNKKKEFEFYKICEASYSDGFDISQIILIGLIFLIILASVKDYLQSRLEIIIVEKYTEIKNPENLFIISCVIAVLIIFLIVIELYHQFIFFIILIVSPLSIALISEALLKNNKYTNPDNNNEVNWISNLEHMTYEIPYIGSVTMFFIFCFGIGSFLTFIWLTTYNWLLNNLISISISIITIRIFKFTSFKFIFLIYVIAIIYDYIWIKYFSLYNGENSRLTNKLSGMPVKLLCPDMNSSPFHSCNSLPIADIILPGILLTYSKKFDELKYNSVYFNIGLITLGSGLIINLLVFYCFSLPTPSFLFTGPIILITTLVIAYKKHEIYDFIEGFRSTSYENKSRDNIEKFVLSQRRRSDSKDLYRPPIELTLEMNKINNN